MKILYKNLIPKLKTQEHEGLEKSILKEGVRDALLVWNDTLIDGHNRLEICEKHNIEYRTEQIQFKNEDEAKVWIIENQLARRNLNDWQVYNLLDNKRKILKAKGKENKLGRGKVLSIVDKTNTQKEIAKELGFSTGKVAQADVVKKNATPEIKQQLESNDISIHQAYKEIKKKQRTEEIKKNRQELAERGETVTASEKWNIYHGDIRKWQANKQYDYIITDPPYPKEYLPLWGILADRAREWLNDGGLLIAMSGQSYLNEIHKLLSEHLDYYWTAAYLTLGQPTPMRHVNVNTTWKPLLIYKKGEYKGKIFGDVFKSDGNDKENHKWGQSESGMIDIISKICLPGQSILDPFCGAGTTGIAALKNGCYFDGLDIEIDNVNISKARL